MNTPTECIRQRLTWDPRGPAPYESMWSILLKVAALNSLSAAELHGLLSPVQSARTRRNVRLSSIDLTEVRPAAHFLGITESRLKAGSLEALGFDSGARTAYAPRHCPECFRLGYHCSLFDLPFVAVCPWHSTYLCHGCSICARALGSRSSNQLQNSARWVCRTCGVYFDFHQHRRVNRIDSGTEFAIQALGDGLTAWWTGFCTCFPDSYSLAAPLLREQQETSSLHNSWRLGLIEALVPHPARWTFTDRPLLTHAVAPIRGFHLAKASAKVISLGAVDDSAFKAMRRALFRRFVARHRKCLAELTRLGIFERSALDSQRVCSVSVAWMSWLMAHDYGGLKREQGAEFKLASDLQDIRVGGHAPDGPGTGLQLAYANFFRVWGTIEALIPDRAIRVCIVKPLDRNCDLPHRTIHRSGADSVELLVPDRNALEEPASERCIQRFRARLPMYQAGAAYANSGWNATPDICMPFTIRQHGNGIRNTYWYLEV